MIPEPFHQRQTRGITLHIRRPHVRGEETEDVAQRHLGLDHFLFQPVGSGGGEVGVGPGVRGDLVAFGVGAADYGWPWKRLVVEAALAEVHAGYEEGGFEVVGG